MSQRKYKVLFVDDEERILSGLRRMLYAQRSEWDMSFAIGGQEALNVMAEESFDVIISDMKMPGMTGRQLLEVVHARYPSTARLVLSGQTDKDDILTGIGPIHQYLQKPCKADKLVSTIRRTCQLKNMFVNDALMTAVSGLEYLPSPDSLYQELIAQLNTPDVPFAAIGKTIARDIALSTKILQLVNSAFFGISRRVCLVEDAVNFLGRENIRSLVVALHIFSQVAKAPTSRFSQQSLLIHSAQVALAAKRIGKCQTDDRELLDDIGVAGLLHDIGKLILASHLPEQYEHTHRLCESSGQPIEDIERQTLGATHGQIGAFLLGLWGFADTIVDAVAFHDRPSMSGATGFTALTAVHVANAVVRAADNGQTSGSPRFDTDHLHAIGLGDRLPAWCSALSEAA